MSKYAEVIYPNSTGESEFSITFEYLEQSHVTVTLDDGAQTNGVDYTINETTSKVVFGGGTGAGEEVVISRTTPVSVADLAVVFTDGSGLNAGDLNDSTYQNIFAIQEMKDSIADSIDIVATAMLGENNLSDVDSASTSRTNLDVYSKAQTDSIFADGSGSLLQANNLSDVDSAATSRTNLDVYSKSEALSVANNLSDLASAATSRNNLDVYSKASIDNKVTAVNIKDYGAVGDDSTDDTTSIQNAISALSGGGILVIPTGIYKTTSALTVSTPNIIIQGSGFSSIIKLYGATANCIELTADGCEVRDLAIDFGTTQTAGSGIIMTSTDLIQVNRVKMTSFFKGISMAGADVTGCKFYNCSLTEGVENGYGIYLATTGDVEDVQIEDTRITGLSLSSQLTAGIYIENGEEIHIDHLNAIHAGPGLYAKATSSKSIQYLTCSNSYINASDTDGIVIETADATSTIDGVTFSNTWVADSTDDGVYINVHTAGKLNNVTLDTCTIVNNGDDGVFVTAGARHTHIHGGIVAGNTDHGVHISANNNDFSIQHADIRPISDSFTANGKWGILIDTGTSNGYRIIGNSLSGNGDGAYFDGGSGVTKVIANNLT